MCACRYANMQDELAHIQPKFMCMCVRESICTHIDMHVRIHTNLHTRARTHTRTHTHTHTHTQDELAQIQPNVHATLLDVLRREQVKRDLSKEQKRPIKRAKETYQKRPSKEEKRHTKEEKRPTKGEKRLTN